MTKTIEVSDETWEKIKHQVQPDEVMEINSLAEMVGKNWFIQTASFHYTGKIKKVVGKFIELEDAAWQAYQPRLKDFLDGQTDEVEPVGSCWVNIDWIVTIIPWKHEIKMAQK